MTVWMPLFAQTGLIIGLFAWLRSDINSLRQDMNARFDAAGKETNTRIKETNARIDVLHQEMNARFDSVHRETSAQFDSARKETGGHFAGLHNDFQAIDVRLARVEATLETTFRLQGILPADRKEQVA